jgi:hypothetical protein
MYRYIVFIIVILFAHSVKGQLFDSIQTAFKHSPKLDARLSAHNAFVSNSYIKVNGVKLGLNYNKIVKIGIGYSWMQPYETTINNVRQFLHLNYGLVYIDYTFYQSKNWEMSIPLQLGLGVMSYRDENRIILGTDAIFLYEPTMAFDYNFLRYFSAGVGYGYRLGVKSRILIKEQFSSPIYTIRFKVKLGSIFSDIKRIF